MKVRNTTSPRRLAGRTLIVAVVLLSTLFGSAFAQPNRVEVVSDIDGHRILVDGKAFMVNGMNWDYFPIGTNHTYSLWNQTDEFIRSALDREMLLLRNMGVNTIRVYVGMPAKWIAYVYENYGIYTMLNHPLGRYGVDLPTGYVPLTDYSDPEIRALLLAEIEQLARDYKDTPGLLMYLLGNENNYGLEWSSAETEALPEGERLRAKARYLYSLFGEAVDQIHAVDRTHPVAMANGDLQYLDIIAEEAANIDVFGSNVYRGISFRDYFEEVEEYMGVPTLFTEFGSDAFNARTMSEDQMMQARYLLGQWEEIYLHAAGNGGVGNSVGGLTFQFSDGWWKYLQDVNLDVHDTNASWPNRGYLEDFIEGGNNMNEEWWGICAKGPTDAQGHYQLYPRAAYYALAKVHSLDPYAPGVDRTAVLAWFDGINPMQAMLQARGDKAALEAERTGMVRLSNLRMEFTTFNTGGDNTIVPDQVDPDYAGYPDYRGFGHMESFYTEFTAQPVDNVRGTLELNILGNVPTNPIDEIFYENRGRPKDVVTVGQDGNFAIDRLDDVERVKVYRSELSWEERLFNLDYFYRTGHYHWGYQGDFFGLYREANYGPNIDIYNGNAPHGVEISGKGPFNDLVVAYGPELWWGANPAVMGRYGRMVGPLDITAVYQRDLEQRETTESSNAVPQPKTEKIALNIGTELGPFGIQLGGLHAGNNMVGRTFQLVEGESGNYTVLEDDIKDSDTFGGKVKITYTGFGINWYAQAAVMGLVAEGGPTQAQTFTGWHLKDSGSGNQQNILTGFSTRIGYLEIAPNFLYQEPIIGPIPSDVPAPGRPRNILDDPFSVRANRETIGYELLLAWDPTPATWLHTWDSDFQEDAAFAAVAGLIYRDHPTTADAGIGILDDGVTPFAFSGATPPRDLWESYARLISKSSSRNGVIVNLFAGEGEADGDDDRLITRYGGDLRLIHRKNRLILEAKFDDWGPYDYHKDFNLTYPMQLMGDISFHVGTPQWWELPESRFGVRATYRTLNEYSPRSYYIASPLYPSLPQEDGSEWEIRTYLHISLNVSR
ncbi:glycosidase [bacterium]|nr:glycosidase [bacterium]